MSINQLLTKTGNGLNIDVNSLKTNSLIFNNTIICVKKFSNVVLPIVYTFGAPGNPYVNICDASSIVGSLDIEPNEINIGDIFKIVVEGSYTTIINTSAPVIKLTVGNSVYINDLNIFLRPDIGSYSFRLTITFSYNTIGTISQGPLNVYLESSALSGVVGLTQASGVPSSLTPAINSTIKNTILLQVRGSTACIFRPYFIYCHKL